MKIAIPVLEASEKAKVSPHFGRAPFFAIFDTETEKLDFVKNTSEHFGGKGTPAEIIAEQKPDCVFALDMGSKAIALFKSLNITVKTGSFETLEEVIKNQALLEELEKSCGH